MTNDLTSLGDWQTLPFFATHWPTIRSALSHDESHILPPENMRFAALARTSLKDTRVVILGQDPYPTRGHANGLAFSVAPDIALPRSLRNIFRELQDDIGSHPENGDLTHWADQGVLLLNTALSVPEGAAGAHARLGWSHLTRNVLHAVSHKDRAFVLWGKHAQSFRSDINGSSHLIIETAHPSPLSARRGFFGSRPFSRINAWLLSRGEAPIDWVGKP